VHLRIVDVSHRCVAPTRRHFLQKPLNFKKLPVLLKSHGGVQRRIVALEMHGTQTHQIDA
jgi:hypothetical protein